MAAVRKPANNKKDARNKSLNCADAKSYLCQAASKNDANLCVYNPLSVSTNIITGVFAVGVVGLCIRCSVVHERAEMTSVAINVS